VHEGSLVLDEPTNLPEGQVVRLVPADDPVVEVMTDDEREQLRRELEASFAEESFDATEVLAELRALG
jgi:hypothetical protein